MIGDNLTAQESDGEKNEEHKSRYGATNTVPSEQHALYHHTQEQETQGDDKRIPRRGPYFRKEFAQIDASAFSARCFTAVVKPRGIDPDRAS